MAFIMPRSIFNQWNDGIEFISSCHVYLAPEGSPYSLYWNKVGLSLQAVVDIYSLMMSCNAS